MENQVTVDDVDDTVVAYLNGIARDEQQYPENCRIPFTAGPFTTFVMIGALQLAMRHPNMNEWQREMLRQVTDQLKEPFRDTPVWDLLNRGDDPANDVPSDGGQPEVAPSFDAVPCPACGSLRWVADLTPGADITDPLTLACKDCGGSWTTTELMIGYGMVSGDT